MDSQKRYKWKGKIYSWNELELILNKEMPTMDKIHRDVVLKRIHHHHTFYGDKTN